MKADAIPLIVGAIVFLSSLISLKSSLSVAIAKIVLDAAGNLYLKPEEWLPYSVFGDRFPRTRCFSVRKGAVVIIILVLPFAVRCLGRFVLIFCLGGIIIVREDTSDEAEALLCEKRHHRDRLPRIRSCEWPGKFHLEMTEPI
jgi:hypothetical protein